MCCLPWARELKTFEAMHDVRGKDNRKGRRGDKPEIAMMNHLVMMQNHLSDAEFDVQWISSVMKTVNGQGVAAAVAVPAPSSTQHETAAAAVPIDLLREIAKSNLENASANETKTKEVMYHITILYMFIRHHAMKAVT